MASQSETGFGIKIRKAQDLLLAINSFPVYDPPREEESIAEMTLLVNTIMQLNTDEAAFKEHYRIAVDDRQHAFRGQPGSVHKLLSPIANAVAAQYGGTKYTYMVKDMVRKMRSSKSAVPSGSGSKPGISTAEHSYGAMTKAFNDLVTTLSQFPDYDPSNPSIALMALEQKAVELNTLNDLVTEKALVLRDAKDQRAASYQILKERVTRIKAYIKAQYGHQSPQYHSIKVMKL